MINILSRVGVSARRMRAAANSILAGDDLEKAASHPSVGSSDAPWQIINDQHQIQHVLRYILDMKCEITLTGQSQQRMVRSRIVGIDQTLGGHFLIERVADDAAHAALLENGHVNLGSRFLELPIVCPVDISHVGEVEGKSCYRVPLPNWILFSEMRDSWRVVPRDTQLLCLIYSPSGQAAIEASVVDISEGGIGLLLPQQFSYQPTTSECWHSTLHSGNGEAIGLELDLRHVSRDLNRGYRIGATIRTETAEDHQRLHQLIVRHQLLFANLN